MSAARRAAAAMLLCSGALAAAAGPTVVDDSGHRVSLERPAERIVSLAPHTTELLYAVGAGPRVVATVASADHPPAAQRLPRVGDADQLNVEAIVAREPDLVVAWGSGNPAAQIERLRALGVPVYVDEPRALADIAVTLLELGRLTGRPEAGRARGDRFRQRLARLRARFAQRPALGVFYQVWDEPLMTVNGAHVISDVIRGCGGRNVFADLGALAPRVSFEAVLERDPDVIVAGAPPERAERWLARWRDWPELDAVARGHLLEVDPDYLQRHTPRILTGMARLCRGLERVRAARTGS